MPMYNLTIIKAAFASKITFRSSLNPDYSGLDDTTTTTGLYYDDFHPLVNQENLDAIAVNYDAFNNSAWSALTTYGVGDQVINDDILYISKAAANLNHEPPDSTWWKIGLSVFLEQLENQAIINMLDGLLRKKKLLGNTKGSYSNLILYDGVGKISDTITKESRFVFLEVRMKRYDNLRFVLDRIGLQTTQIQAGLTLYIYHSSRKAYVDTVTFISDKTYTMEWVTAGKNLDYFGYSTEAAREQDAGGYYYIGYFEDDLTGQAISKSFDLSQSPRCGGCATESYNKILYDRRSDFVQVRAGSVANVNLNGTDMWDVQYNEYDRSETWGLNLGFSIQCDLTRFFADRVDMFRDLLAKQVVFDCLQKMAYTTRDSRLSEQVKAEAILALKGEGKNYETVLQEAYEEADIDTKNLGTPCLAKNKTGLTVSSI